MFRKTIESSCIPSSATSEPTASDNDTPPVLNDAVSAHASVSDLVSAATPPTTESAPKSPSKRSLVLDLLHRDDGATLPELTAATGWQAHSVRAVLTGLRKRGYVLEKSIRNGATCYQILDAADA